MNKTIAWVVAALIVIVGGVYLFTRTSNTSNPNDQTATDNGSQSQAQQQNQNPNAEGRVVFSVTDAAVDMTAISEVNLKISKVEAHHSINGWTTISTTPKTYALLSLNAKKQSQLLADVKAKVGTYDQVRLTVDSVSVTTRTGAVKTAKLPSGELKINTLLAVAEGYNSSVNLDFLAKESLHTTGLGDYIFAPVVKTQTQSNAVLTVDTSGVVVIGSGRVDDTNTMGMDIDGSVKANFLINDNQKLQIGTDGKIKIDTSL